MLAHFEGERGACELESENITVVVNLLFTYDLELGLDGFSVFSGDLLEVRGVTELANSGFLRYAESLEEVIESDHQ